MDFYLTRLFFFHNTQIFVSFNNRDFFMRIISTYGNKMRLKCVLFLWTGKLSPENGNDKKTSLIVSENKKCTVLLKSLGKARRQEGDEAVKHEYVSGRGSVAARANKWRLSNPPRCRQTLVEPKYCRPTHILTRKSNLNYVNKPNPFQLMFFV